MADPHGSYLTLGRARWLSWFDLRQSWALGISEKVVKKCHLLFHFLNFLCMLIEDMFADKLRALGKEERVRTQRAFGKDNQPPNPPIPLSQFFPRPEEASWLHPLLPRV